MPPLDIRVGTRQLAQMVGDRDDPRGILWIFERPRATANYVTSCDPSYGIPGWHRSLRTEDDWRTDNCAIEVIRMGSPNVQVAEWAGPIDPEDAAELLNFIARMYAGAGEEGESHVIIEVQPGPGLLTQRDMINKFGYSNLFQWEHLDRLQVQQTQAYGWFSSRQSRQSLWIKGVRHITKGGIVINSPALIEEMTDLQQDNFLNFTARAQWGAHDDRMLALLMGIWAANKWSWDNPIESTGPAVDRSLPDYQCSDITAEDMMDDWNDRFSQLTGG